MGNKLKAKDLIQDGHNYRKHSEGNIEHIQKSIKEAGLGRSVVIDADGVLIAGNGVQRAVAPDTPARIIETDGNELIVVKRIDLHEGDERRKKLAMADNATADDVEWDVENLADDWDLDELRDDWNVNIPNFDGDFNSDDFFSEGQTNEGNACYNITLLIPFEHKKDLDDIKSMLANLVAKYPAVKLKDKGCRDKQWNESQEQSGKDEGQ